MGWFSNYHLFLMSTEESSEPGMFLSSSSLPPAVLPHAPPEEESSGPRGRPQQNGLGRHADTGLSTNNGKRDHGVKNKLCKKTEETMHSPTETGPGVCMLIQRSIWVDITLFSVSFFNLFLFKCSASHSLHTCSRSGRRALRPILVLVFSFSEVLPSRCLFGKMADVEMLRSPLSKQLPGER